MAQTRHYEIEGLSLEIPLRYDAHSGLYIEEYPDFKANPAYTPRGSPVMFIGEDLDVLLELCDRILVLCGGRVSGVVDGRTATKEEVGLLMTRVGGGKEGEADA